FWTTKSKDCDADLQTFERHHRNWSTKGLQLLTINVDSVLQAADSPDSPIKSRSSSFASLRCTEDVAAIYNILYRQLFDRHRDLSLPTSFLIDEAGDIVKVYQGP